MTVNLATTSKEMNDYVTSVVQRFSEAKLALEKTVRLFTKNIDFDIGNIPYTYYETGSKNRLLNNDEYDGKTIDDILDSINAFSEEMESEAIFLKKNEKELKNNIIALLRNESAIKIFVQKINNKLNIYLEEIYYYPAPTNPKYKNRYHRNFDLSVNDNLDEINSRVSDLSEDKVRSEKINKKIWVLDETINNFKKIIPIDYVYDFANLRQDEATRVHYMEFTYNDRAGKKNKKKIPLKENNSYVNNVIYVTIKNIEKLISVFENNSDYKNLLTNTKKSYKEMYLDIGYNENLRISNPCIIYKDGKRKKTIQLSEDVLNYMLDEQQFNDSDESD